MNGTLVRMARPLRSTIASQAKEVILSHKTQIGMLALCVGAGAMALSVALAPAPAGACSILPAPVDISLKEVRHISGPAADDGSLDVRLDEEYAHWPDQAILTQDGSLMLDDSDDESFRVEVR